jgi:carboxyl-terminal processing protease
MKPLLAYLRAAVAAVLLLAGGAAPASAPIVTDEMLAPLEAAYLRAVKPGEEAELHRGLFSTVLNRVQRSYAREVDASQLITVALKTLAPLEPGAGEPAEVFRRVVNAALGSLDPYSRYLDPRALTQQRAAITGTFGGLGLQVELADKLVRVKAAIPNTPAARAGLQTGDLIIRLDDQPVDGMTLAEAVAKMRGEPGTPVELTIRRAQEEMIFPLVREVIRREPVRWSMEGDVLVLRLVGFLSPTFAEMEKAIAQASVNGDPRAIVLDLRGNGGGLFRQAVQTADAFMPGGAIVSLRGRTAGNRRTWQADASERLAGVPMVILIDGGTASAAELVAAALQESGRAIVMGQRSYGKGSVQAMLSLGEGKGALRLTTALYHGPSGRTVQRTGVGPDIELVPLHTAANRRRESDRARALPGADEPPAPKARVEEARCAAPGTKDLALACALAFIDAGAIETFVAALPQ